MRKPVINDSQVDKLFHEPFEDIEKIELLTSDINHPESHSITLPLKLYKQITLQMIRNQSMINLDFKSRVNPFQMKRNSSLDKPSSGNPMKKFNSLNENVENVNKFKSLNPHNSKSFSRIVDR